MSMYRSGRTGQYQSRRRTYTKRAAKIGVLGAAGYGVYRKRKYLRHLGGDLKRSVKVGYATTRELAKEGYPLRTSLKGGRKAGRFVFKGQRWLRRAARFFR